ncbi:HAUS augmin-like complex subunit 5 [Lampris incognitus]|uniref:HAUS augmin-like complex subunit 5 n=1 Tax=Lampris incognitus TaxID=2546036 RepID=UPI0024B5D155|nr:HAUS augmin-like complex subunit 5 [Lampris incognitus]
MQLSYCRMGDRHLAQELRRWATEEFGLPQQSLPNDSYFKTLCVGSGKSIWKYIIQHVFHQKNVRIMRGNLQWYKVLQDKELKQAEGQSKAAKKNEIQEQIEQLRLEISQLDSQISGTEDQLATEEHAINCTWAQGEESRRRELLLQAFRQRCFMDRQVLREDTCKISGHCQAMEELARRAEVDMLFGSTPFNCSGEDHLAYSSPEPQILRELRELCDERVVFFQSLQESELKRASPATIHMTCQQRDAVFKYWLSTVEDVLHSYPPNQVLLALQYLASRQQKELEEKVASLDVTQDVTALRFRFDSNHLLDVSREEEQELPPVKNLLQSAWEEVEENLIELAQARSRIQQLQSQLQAQKRDAQQEMSGLEDELHSDALALSVLEVELQCVMQAATRDFIREQCLHLDQQAKSQQKAVQSVQSQWQGILDFRQLVDARQGQIKGLIKGNSMAKTELTRLHNELGEFVQGRLVPKFGEVITAASKLRNSIFQEAKQFAAVSLLALDYRTVEELQKIPASWLSIHRLRSSSFHSLCQSMSFPLYRAPEELCSQACSQHLELSLLRQLLQLHSSALQKLQKQMEQLHAPDQKALLYRVREEDQRLLNTLVPRVQTLAQHYSMGLSYSSHVKTAISHWWNQPAQHVVPEMINGGLTLRQWLQRWKLAAKAAKGISHKVI